MDWKNFFKLQVSKDTRSGTELFFEAQLKVNDHFPIQDLIMPKFDRWDLTQQEKKRLSLGLRKILLCHGYFNSPEFKKISDEFLARLWKESGNLHRCSTHAGGIYLFLALLQDQKRDWSNKKIICQTSELPLEVMKVKAIDAPLQLIYRPENHSYLADFPSLWETSEFLSLFECKDNRRKLA